MFLSDPQRVNVLGEYGGIGLPLENHLWWNKRNWGYVQFKDSEAVTAEYVKYANQLKDFVKRGFSAAVYTQTTDVEGEVNGLMTYDRKVIKINEAKVKAANHRLLSSRYLNKKPMTAIVPKKRINSIDALRGFALTWMQRVPLVRK